MTTAPEAQERQQEIIIVRRSGDDEDEGHHGGVWKIAFADFMTAMMCFFLVMWLINAANEETRVALASYFNPVKLIDRNTNSKGLEEIGQGPQSSTVEPNDAEKFIDAPRVEYDETSGPSTFRNSAELADTRKYSDENFFSNPYAVLAEIASDIGKEQNISQKGEGGQRDAGPSSGASGGEAYRDPFAPDFWSQQVDVPQVGVEGDPDKVRQQPAGADARALETGEYPLAAEESAHESVALAESDHDSDKSFPESSAKREAADAAPDNTDAPREHADAASENTDVARESADASEEKADAVEAAAERGETADNIGKAIAKALEGEGLATSVTVSAGEDGVLISITDDIRDSMFAVGSAVPEQALVLAMEKIGRVLAERPGAIHVNGHTDARPFASKDYDNWRLSTARAHAAQYMLVRGGLDEERLKEVAGFADRRLKLPNDPLAAANRRIEILVETPQ